MIVPAEGDVYRKNKTTSKTAFLKALEVHWKIY